MFLARFLLFFQCKTLLYENKIIAPICPISHIGHIRPITNKSFSSRFQSAECQRHRLRHHWQSSQRRRNLQLKTKPYRNNQ